jgi:GDP-L-fucose synthase
MQTESSFKLRNKRVWVAGHRGLVGSALVRRLESEECEILTAPRSTLDLRNGDKVDAWMARARPDVIFLAAATVGGIHANQTRPGEFLYDNLMIQANVIESARRHNVGKLMALGSSCIYPRLTTQPITEDALLTGPLEPTNEFYAVAKIAGIKLCQAYRRQYDCDFISVMPTNLYGPGDNFDLTQSHVVPALIAKVHQAKMSGAKSVTLWGTGGAIREFLHADDAADGLVYIMKHYSGEAILNLGTGDEVTVLGLGEIICRIVGFEGRIDFDHTKPDGTPKKLVDTSRLNKLGWRPRVDLLEGLTDTYNWYLANKVSERVA